MIDEVKNYLREVFKEYKSTFHQTSFDKNNKIYLCEESNLEVFNFDSYIKHDKKGENLPASPDAIYLNRKKVYSVEFKNAPFENIKNKVIINKFISGTNILKDLLKQFNLDGMQFIFCVVYKPANAKVQFFDSSHIESNIIRFGLEEENKKLDSFYAHIITEDVNFYKKQFQKELTC